VNAILSRLITESYDAVEAESALSFQPTDSALQKLLEAGKAVLSSFPYKPGACTLMSAMWTALIRDNTEYPIHAVAGSLFIDGHHLFGSDSTANQRKGAFKGINLDWDGHCWIIFGNLIGDVSLFRTAYSNASPRVLKEKVLSVFGEGRGLFVMPADTTTKRGIRYEPKYVLTDDEITGLCNGALSMIENQLVNFPGADD